MPYILEPKDLDALLAGFAILGTGGGGDPEWGRAIIENDWAKGRSYKIVLPHEVPDDAVVCSGGIMGSVKQLEAMSYPEIVALWEEKFLLTGAIGMMEDIIGRKVDYLMPFEVGGLNTPVVMTAAARMGIPVIDGDFVGRAAPETQMTTCVGLGVSLYPMPVMDSLGNQVVVLAGSTPAYADEIGRLVVGKGGGYAANAHYPMPGKDMKRVCVPGTVTHCLQAGRTVLEAQEKGEDPVKAFQHLMKGRRLFRGKVTGLAEEQKLGFYVTTATLEGLQDFAGQTARLVIKNESMALWVEDKVRIIFPDLACMLDSASGLGVLSSAIEAGTDMTIIGVPCHPNLRRCLETEAGRAAHGGARYGCPDLEYVPLEGLD